ncbi:MAG: NUDIX hydrolase [Gemmatimonadaceae bacterium]|jgi:ADP-ribose pyrophosphatase YjhB (NUDIX family)|nr:NUDIX hydrolase [Gemmatimonadaceae bacterium]
MSEPTPRRRRRRRARHRKRGGRQSAATTGPSPASVASADAAADAAAAAAAVIAEAAAAARQDKATTRVRAPRLETSAGGVVVRLVDGRPRVLLIRDSYRNWGFPKGHLEDGETAADAALREVREETGLADVAMIGAIDTIDWHFRFRGRLVHKTCHFFLMKTRHGRTRPQRAEGITACRWVALEEAEAAISYANARDVLRQAREMLDAAPLEGARAPSAPVANATP